MCISLSNGHARATVLSAVKANGESVVAVQASNEQGEKYTLKAAELAPYTEDGDFGVC